MEPRGAGRQGVGWTIWSLVGIAAWIGVTVFVGATNDDPSDSGPITRTFAIAGGVFFAITFGAAGLQMRGRKVGRASGLYRRLALREVDDAELRHATRGLTGLGWTYLLFGAVTTALMLVAIGLRDEDVFAVLLWTALGIVVVWLGVMVYALRRAWSASDAFAEPLGLRLVETPSYGVRDLRGGVVFAGERHGRTVEIRQGVGVAHTTVAGNCSPATWRNPQQFAALTGEPWTSFRRVTATAGPDRVVVERTGKDAGRWMLTDLLLAEALATRG